MKTQKLTTSCLLFLCLLCSGYGKVKGSFLIPFYQEKYHLQKDRLFDFEPKTLFVFGDSYADTGNNPITVADSWKFPYGITFPGKPSGRYSDGRVSTDYFAKYLRLRSPIPYRWKRYATKNLKYGMNFAYGGAGVFETIFNVPNTTLQIDNFQQLLREEVYSTADLRSSVALFSIAGNDYFTYINRNGTAQGLKTFIMRVVNKMVLDVKRIQSLGVRKVGVATLPPLGCLPTTTVAGGFRQCDGTRNAAAEFHNALLRQALIKLNHHNKETAFFSLDIYTAFLTVLRNKGVPGISKFPNPLRPCCVGTKKGYSCGRLDKNGVKMFKFCKDPKSHFFWDSVHPSNEAWRSVYSLLLPNSTP